MTALAWLIPAALVLGALGLAAFLWALRRASSRIWKARPIARWKTTRPTTRSAATSR
ncbi:cbb3-type cytochrome oxidase assembly protein CcoS [Methyloceanibacter marginalis]|uniref:cbb3-type cytochrome oxidase assembly protein CcoS n=1 Tax=Methyloceanibacter marginalis TaxID=1774971 RepID=UPI003CC79DE7